MMKCFVALALVALNLLVVGLPASTYAADVTQLQFSGTSAGATWSSVDGCTRRVLNVFATDEKVQQSGQLDRSSLAIIFLYEENPCTATERILWHGVAALPLDAFAMTPNRTSATLHTTITAIDHQAGTLVPVDINLTWTATDGSDFQRYNEHTSMPGWKFHSYYRDKVKYAAVAGTVMAAGHNLTPNAGEGGMMSAKQNIIEITQH